MKLTVIFDPAGNITGAIQPATNGQKAAGSAELQSGIDTMNGQTVHDIEVPDSLAKLEGADLFKKLEEVDAVKQTLKSLVTSGQAN